MPPLPPRVSGQASRSRTRRGPHAPETRRKYQAQGFRQQMEDATDFEDHGVTLYRPYMLNLVDPKIVGV